MGCVLAHVLDHGRPARAQDSVHLRERTAWQCEVLERGLAHDQVEGLGFERHSGRIALAELNSHSRLEGVIAGNLDERVADVEARYMKPSESRHLDRQVPGPGCNLEHPGAVRKAIGQEPGLLTVRIELALRSSHACVPPRDRSFHLGALESPPSCFSHLHLASPLSNAVRCQWRKNT